MNRIELGLTLYILKNPDAKFNGIKIAFSDLSDRTIKRYLTGLTKRGFLIRTGGSRSISYAINRTRLLTLPISTEEYFSHNDDERTWVLGGFDIQNVTALGTFEFTKSEKGVLSEARDMYLEHSKDFSETLHRKEMQRLVIELSWKSSQIEGNTYSLLDTEQLIAFGVRSPKNTESETQMVLNHKAAFDFIIKNPELFLSEKITRGLCEEIHKILVHNLGVPTGVRKLPVAITGTAYIPAGFESQIKEALDTLFTTIRSSASAEEQALALLVGISYIQPFEDGNKRTARMIANAVLFARNLPMLSYRTVSAKDYKERMLVFYETGIITPIKELFIEQYVYAAGHYRRRIGYFQ